MLSVHKKKKTKNVNKNPFFSLQMHFLKFRNHQTNLSHRDLRPIYVYSYDWTIWHNTHCCYIEILICIFYGLWLMTNHWTMQLNIEWTRKKREKKPKAKKWRRKKKKKKYVTISKLIIKFYCYNLGLWEYHTRLSHTLPDTQQIQQKIVQQTFANTPWNSRRKKINIICLTSENIRRYSLAKMSINSFEFINSFRNYIWMNGRPRWWWQ